MQKLIDCSKFYLTFKLIVFLYSYVSELVYMVNVVIYFSFLLPFVEYANSLVTL